MGSQSAKSSVKKVTTQDSNPEDAVLVFGATGKLGRLVAKQVILSRPPTLETNSVQIFLGCYILWVFLTASASSSVPKGLVVKVKCSFSPSSPGHTSCAHARRAIVVEGDLSE